MAMATRSADVVWEGNLAQGKGVLDSVSGAFKSLPVSWPARTEASNGNTSPEELIAAAHASCYAMALSHVLGQQGQPPQRLEVHADCDLDKTDTGVKISRIQLRVRGAVAGLDDAGFKEAAAKAEQGCPVSNALRNNVAISVDAALA